jgi:PhnB protein
MTTRSKEGPVQATSRIPDNYPRVCPYLYVDDGAAAIAFYTKVLGATERGGRMLTPDGKIGHSELQIGDSLIMVADEFPHMDVLGPKSVGGTPVTLHVYVADVDQVFAVAIMAGAEVVRAVQDEFYGDRAGTFADPFGHRWNVASHVEDVEPEEMQRRLAAAMNHAG